jgi:hypothetical protein
MIGIHNQYSLHPANCELVIALLDMRLTALCSVFCTAITLSGYIQPCFPVMLWLYELVLSLAHMIRLNCIFARHVVTPFCTVTLTG